MFENTLNNTFIDTIIGGYDKGFGGGVLPDSVLDSFGQGVQDSFGQNVLYAGLLWRGTASATVSFSANQPASKSIVRGTASVSAPVFTANASAPKMTYRPSVSAAGLVFTATATGSVVGDFTPTDLVFVDFGDTVFRMSGATSTVKDSFSTSGLPQPHRPTAAAWDYSNGDLLFSGQGPGAEVVLVCSGFSNTVQSTFLSPDTTPNGLGFDGTDVYLCGAATSKVYKFSGITGTVTDSFSFGSVPYALVHHSGDLYVSDANGVHKMSGFTSTKSTSVDVTGSAATPGGVGFDSDGDLWVLDESVSPSVVYEFSGFTNTVKSSFSTSGFAVTNIESLAFME